MEKSPSLAGFKLVTKDSISWLQLAFLQRSNLVLDLCSGGGSIMGSPLFAILACCTFGSFSEFIALESKTKVVKKPSYSKLLNMGKGDVTKSDVPLHPNLLKGR